MARPASIDPELLAIAVLGFIAQDPARLSRFLDITGLSPATLRGAAGQPGFLASVLEYLLGDESLMLAFCAENGHAPESVAQAASRLSRDAGAYPDD